MRPCGLGANFSYGYGVQVTLDQILADLAATRDDREAQNAVLRQVSEAVLQAKGLGGQMIARLCTLEETAPELADFEVLLAVILPVASMEYDTRQERGSDLLDEIEEAVNLAVQQKRIGLHHRLFMARSWSHAGLRVPAALELRDLSEVGLDASSGNPRVLESLFEELAREADGDAYALYLAFTEIMPVMPAEAHEAMIELIASCPEAVFEEVGFYWLLNEKLEIRRAAARGLGARLKDGNLSAQAVFRLPELRNWIPKDAARFDLDRVIKNALRANLRAEATTPVWQCHRLLASLPNEVGEQSIAAVLSSGDSYAVALMVLAADRGVADAHILDFNIEAEQAFMIQSYIDGTDALDVPLEYVSLALSFAIDAGMARGLPPVPALLRVAEALQLASLRPMACTVLDILHSLRQYEQVSQYSKQKRIRLVNESQHWWEDQKTIANWCDCSDEAYNCLMSQHSERAQEKALWDCLEHRRIWWAVVIARSALLFDSIGHPEAPSFIATALALVDGVPLKKIPVMEDIHAETLIVVEEFDEWPTSDDWDEEDLDDDDFDEVLDTKFDVEPKPEKHGELDEILAYGLYGSAWIDGYLTAVMIVPEIISPDKWLVSLLATFSDQMSLPVIQRFLEVVSMRADDIFALLGQKGAAERRMLQYDRGDVQEWAAGFEVGYEGFKELWSAASLSDADRAILRQIIGGVEGEFGKPFIRDLGEWLEARHLANIGQD